MERIIQIFKDYDGQGIHRTGTETDTRNAHWLAEAIKAMGQTPHRAISLLGSNGLFHHIDDRWPHAVDLDKTVRLVDAFTDILLQIAR